MSAIAALPLFTFGGTTIGAAGVPLAGTATLGGTTVTLGGALSALGAAGTLASGLMQASAAQQNAEIARQQAEFNAQQRRRQIAALTSRQTAAFGASGVRVGEGSPVEVLASDVYEGELDAMGIIYGGEAEAQAAEARGRQAVVGGFTRAGTSLLTQYGR